MQLTFVKIVQNHFSFLVRDFGFILSSATESPRGEQLEGDVQYISNVTLININCTRGEQPYLWLGRVQDGKRHLLPLQVIYEYASLSNEQKSIVLSPSEGRQAASLLNKKQLPRFVSLSDDKEERVKLQLENYARYLREYALPFLKGDFSQWLEIWEYQVEKLTVEYSRTGRSEFVPIVATDENGQLRVTGKQHVFKESLDYISALKGELSG